MKAVSPRIIAHVDLDAFFAAVEEREHHEYKGKPIVWVLIQRTVKGAVSLPHAITRQGNLAYVLRC